MYKDIRMYKKILGPRLEKRQCVKDEGLLHKNHTPKLQPSIQPAMFGPSQPCMLLSGHIGS